MDLLRDRLPVLHAGHAAARAVHAEGAQHQPGGVDDHQERDGSDLVAEGREEEDLAGEQQALQPVPLREHRHGQRDELQLEDRRHRHGGGRHARGDSRTDLLNAHRDQQGRGDGRDLPQLRLLLRLHHHARAAYRHCNRHGHGQDLGHGIGGAARHDLLHHRQEAGRWFFDCHGLAICGGLHGHEGPDHAGGAHGRLGRGGLVQAVRGQGHDGRACPPRSGTA